MRYYAFLQALEWLSICSASSLPSSSKRMLKKFSSLVVFGDSYTDQGVHQYRPLSDGTIGKPKDVTSTGGRIWPQYVQQYSEVNLYDYAVSGAVCSSTFSPTIRSGVKEDQIPTFLADNVYVNNNTGKIILDNPSDETIYAVWIGTNDLGNRAFLTDVQPSGVHITSYIDCVYEQIDRLHQIGARHFVLMNIAPLHLTPQYALPENGGVTNSSFWKDKTTYNANITQTSEKIRQYVGLVNKIYDFQTPHEVKVAKRYPGSSFAVFDVHSLITDIWKHPSLYLNGTAALNVTGFVRQCASTSCATLSSRDSFIWYDELHPSEQTSRIIAREFLDVVNGKSNWTTYWTSRF